MTHSGSHKRTQKDHRASLASDKVSIHESSNLRDKRVFMQAGPDDYGFGVAYVAGLQQF